jgi:DNA-binding NarL/FixJ family response regulator
MEVFKVVVVDDHIIFRNGLKLLLNKIENVDLIAEATNGKEFLDILKKKKIDLVFMDINMPILDGFDATEMALIKKPKLKIIILTTFGDNEYFSRMIQLGIAGYMLKNSGIEDIKTAITKVMNGGNYYSEQLLINISKDLSLLARNKNTKEDLPELSRREKEVLGLICKGFSNDKIGEELNISGRTVERHKSNLLQKTNSKNTLNLVIYAFKNDIINL